MSQRLTDACRNALLRTSAVRSLTCIAAPLCSLFLANAHAGELFSGRLYTVPEKIFVSQAFEIHFELEASAGCEVDDLRINDFPNAPELITVGRLESSSRNRISRNGQAIDVLHFTAAARCHMPVDHVFVPKLQCMLVERTTQGFFSHWQSYPAQRQLEPFTLRVLPLPEAGRPASYSGAVGTFRLTGHLSQSRVRPGDIVTLTLELAGQGWLGQAPIPTPSASPLFKYYPAKETLREALRVTTQQVVIPASTNATELAAIRFSYFNPSVERYEESVAGPFALTFTSEATPTADEVRVIGTADTDAPVATSGTLTAKHADITFQQAAPLLAVCFSALVSLLLFLMLYGRHTVIAGLTAGTALALGIAAGFALGRHRAEASLTLAHRVEARFAPSSSSARLFSLNPGTPVVPLEKAGAWTRIDAAGHRGWIPASALSGANPSPDAH